MTEQEAIEFIFKFIFEILPAIFAIALFLEQAWRIEDDRRLQKQIDELRKEIQKR